MKSSLGCLGLFLLGVVASGNTCATSQAEAILARAHQARAACLTEKPGYSIGAFGRVTERAISVCVVGNDGTLHVLRAWIPYPAPPGRPYPGMITVRLDRLHADAGYRVTHLAGKGIPRLQLRVTLPNGEEVIPQAYAQTSFPDGKPKDARTLAAYPPRVVVTQPYHASFYDDALVQTGYDFLKKRMEVSMRELGDAPSLGVEGKKLGEVFPSHVAIALALIEQIDHDEFMADPKGALAGVLIWYAIAGEQAFPESVSGASAYGHAQFTNRATVVRTGKHRVTHPGTYDMTVLSCGKRGVVLDTVFPRGAQDFANASRAMLCLLDIELERLPVPLRGHMERNPSVVGGFLSVAYNAGGGRAARLWAAMERAKFGVPEFLASFGKGMPQAVEKSVPEETQVYVRKYFAAIEFLREIEQRTLASQ